jgi:hypothetical protein
MTVNLQACHVTGSNNAVNSQSGTVNVNATTVTGKNITVDKQDCHVTG